MTNRPTCPAAAFGCSCGRCVKPEPDLTALKNMNRAYTSTATLLILLAVVLGVFAYGLIREEQRLAREASFNQENLSWR